MNCITNKSKQMFFLRNVFCLLLASVTNASATQGFFYDIIATTKFPNSALTGSIITITDKYDVTNKYNGTSLTGNSSVTHQAISSDAVINLPSSSFDYNISGSGTITNTKIIKYALTVSGVYQFESIQRDTYSFNGASYDQYPLYLYGSNGAITIHGELNLLPLNDVESDSAIEDVYDYNDYVRDGYDRLRNPPKWNGGKKYSPSKTDGNGVRGAIGPGLGIGDSPIYADIGPGDFFTVAVEKDGPKIASIVLADSANASLAFAVSSNLTSKTTESSSFDNPILLHFLDGSPDIALKPGYIYDFENGGIERFSLIGNGADLVLGMVFNTDNSDNISSIYIGSYEIDSSPVPLSGSMSFLFLGIIFLALVQSNKGNNTVRIAPISIA